MVTVAEQRRMLWNDRWMRAVAPRVVGRILNGRAPQPGWLPRRLVTVVSGDADADAGVGAVWWVWRPRSATAEAYTAVLELGRSDGRWRYMGADSGPVASLPAARLPAGAPGQVGMIELGAGTGGVSRPYQGSPLRAPWIEANELRIAAEVDHLLVADRRIPLPPTGPLLIAWTSPSTGLGGTRPLILALAPDGTELSRIGPHDTLDTYTWAKLGGFDAPPAP
ncbi:MAG: hypothetical protein QOF98_2826 [Streptomyces sp.]|nr:hypothetical protein [Streptomyces sp.]